MKVRLREWRKEEVELLAKLANNKKVADNMRDMFPYPYTIADAMKWIATNKNQIPQIAIPTKIPININRLILSP